MKNLRKIRKQRKISQYEVADFLHITQSTYSRYERGVIQPDLDTIIKLSKYFDVCTDYLLDQIDIPYTPDQLKFSKRLKSDDDPENILEDFDVKLGGKSITLEEFKRFVEVMKELENKNTLDD